MRAYVSDSHIDWEKLTKINSKKLDEIMREYEVTAVILNTMDNFRWLTGIPITYGWFLRHSHTAIKAKDLEEPIIIGLEGFDYYEKNWFKDVRTLPYYKEVSQPNDVSVWPDLCVGALEDLGITSGIVGVDPGCPFVLKEALERKLPKIEIVDARGILMKARLTKNEEEIKAIRVACTIGEMGMKAGIETIAEGKRERDVAAAIVHAYLLYGAEAPIATPFVISGIRPFFLHASDKIIRRNELVRIDTGCTYAGYHSDFSRTVFVGNPSDELIKTYEALLKAHMMGIEAIKPGVKNTEIYNLVKNKISEFTNGKYQLGWFLAHGIGTGLHEEPILADSAHSTEMILEEGMVFTPEPAIMTPWGNLAIEDDVLVTKTGAEILTKFDRGIEILTQHKH